MQSYFVQLWSLGMTVTVFLLMVPHSTRGHLGAALRTGSGTLTKLTLGDNIIFCTFTDLGEVNKPPILSHVRVSREPQIHQGLVMIRNDLDGSSDPELVHTTKIKSPSYQHKILQFHSNGQTSSGQGFDYFPSKMITSQNYGSTSSLPIYPVASKFGKVDRRLLKGTSAGDYEDESNNGNDSWEINLLPKPDQPTYTPLIGASALTNIPQFFKHLRENIRAMHRSNGQLDPVPPVASPQTLFLVAPGSDGDADKFVENEDIKIATPTRRGYSSNSETSSALEKDESTQDTREPDDKELLHFLGHRRYQYPMANNYNPAWLFTNLGLGKRSSSPPGGGKRKLFLY